MIWQMQTTIRASRQAVTVSAGVHGPPRRRRGPAPTAKTATTATTVTMAGSKSAETMAEAARRVAATLPLATAPFSQRAPIPVLPAQMSVPVPATSVCGWFTTSSPPRVSAAEPADVIGVTGAGLSS